MLINFPSYVKIFKETNKQLKRLKKLGEKKRVNWKLWIHFYF